MKKYNFFKQDAKRPTEEQRLQTKLFYENANEIYAHYDEWKDNNRFYFIPLYMEMTYSCGWVAEMAPDPVWLGSFVRCTLQHPELFQFQCPKCGKPLQTHRYNGSPLSGTVYLEATCPHCGRDGHVTVSGWHIRSKALRAIQKADKLRMLKARLLHPGFKAATMDELKNWLKPTGKASSHKRQP